MGINDLDLVLKYFYDNKSLSSIEVSDVDKKVFDGKRYEDVIILVNKLTSDRYLDKIINSTSGKDYGFKISFDGVLFLESAFFIWKDRPYMWNNIKGIINTIWKIAKVIIIALNALAILYLMWLDAS